MSKFALKTALPSYLAVEKERIESIARGFGLDFFPTVFEMLTYDQMNEIAAYGGFPSRYPHWRFGMEYEQLAKSYEYGLSKIYEMVINNNPSYAYLLEGNSVTDQKLVMCHVFGHVDFFKNNFCFRATDLDQKGSIIDPVRARGPQGYDPDRRWIDKMANHGSRISRHIERWGINRVEAFIDQCLSLENLIDPWAPFTPKAVLRDEDADAEAPESEVPKLAAKEYMDSFINPEEYLTEQKRVRKEKKQERKVPEAPQRDVLKFLLDHAPLERWERDVLEVIREEAYYFVPQMQTKIMNEGWACINGATYVFTDRGMVPMRELVNRNGGEVCDGSRPRAVYDRHVIRRHESRIVHTRRGLRLEGSDNHRLLLADGATWKRLDQLQVGDRLEVSGGREMWAREEQSLAWWQPAVASGLQGVADRLGVSLSTVLRHRAGRTVRSSAAVAAESQAYDAELMQAAMHAKFRILPGKRRAVKIPTVVTKELGAFLGYLVGDGHISRVKRHIGLTTADEPQASAFVDMARHLFDLPAVLKWDDGRWRVLLHSETVSDFLVEAIGMTTGPSAREKRIPDVILRSPEPVVRAFLQAYFDCDGYAGKQGVILSTTSDALAEQVQLLLLNYGILSRRRKQKDGCWHVHIAGASARTFCGKVGFGLARKKEELEKYLLERRWFKEERWDDEVVSIEVGRCDVYDISVEETHRYAAGGFINHNSYWHSKLMTSAVLDASEIVDYADANAGVMATAPGRLNPYKIGVELYRYIEDRWNKGRFGREWEECNDLDAKKNWDMHLGKGREKIFQVRALYNDVTFIDEFLTPEFCVDMKMYTFGFSGRNDRFEIESRDFKEVKEKMLFQLTNFGNPYIRVVDSNYANRGELLLEHQHAGMDLRPDYARETLSALVRVWKRPVAVATKVENKPVLLRYDGKEHASTPYKV